MRRAANPDWDTHTVRTTLSPSPWPSLSLRGRGVAPPRAEWIPPARCTAAMAVHGGAWGLPLLEGEGRGDGKGWAGSDSCPETHLRSMLRCMTSEPIFRILSVGSINRLAPLGRDAPSRLFPLAPGGASRQARPAGLVGVPFQPRQSGPFRFRLWLASNTS